MFIYLPNLFREMPGGRILMAVFFVAALFAGVTSLVNLFEAPTATLQEKLHLRRGTAVAVIGVVGLAVGLCIQGIVSGWMDVCSIYACPIGALLAGVFCYLSLIHISSSCVSPAPWTWTARSGIWRTGT